MKSILGCALALLMAGGGFAGWHWYRRDGAADAPPFRTAAVVRGDLVATIGATGTVEPEEVIDVGAQVAGAINSFGRDAAGRLVRLRTALDAQQLYGLLQIAVRLGERLLAIHHWQPGALAQLLDQTCRNLSHACLPC